MLGVKDMWTHLHSHPSCFLHVWERDMDNASWNVNKKECPTLCARRLPRLRHIVECTTHFAFRLLRMLDHVGHAADNNFRVFSIQNVLDFVKWDLHDNTPFALWGVVM